MSISQKLDGANLTLTADGPTDAVTKTVVLGFTENPLSMPATKVRYKYFNIVKGFQYHAHPTDFEIERDIHHG